MWPPFWRKEHQRCSQGLQSETADTAPRYSPMETLLESPDTVILKISEQVYRGDWTLAPSVLPSQMTRWMHEDLASRIGQVLTRAGLQSETGPSLRRWWCSCSHSTAQTYSPSAGPWGAETAKRLREEPPMGWSSSRRRWTHSRRRSRWRQWQSPPFHAQFSASLLPLALHDPFLLMSVWATPWNSSTCIRGSTSLAAGCGEMTPYWIDTKGETDQVWCWWGVGWWAYIPHRPNPLLSGGQRPRVRKHSQVPYSRAWGSPTCLPIISLPTWEVPDPKYQRSHPLIVPQSRSWSRHREETRSHKLPPQVDCSRNVPAWHPPPLVEEDEG